LDIKLEFFLGENDGFVISGRTAVEQITKSAAAALFAFGGTIPGASPKAAFAFFRAQHTS
jgi:hypothetical protein